MSSVWARAVSAPDAHHMSYCVRPPLLGKRPGIPFYPVRSVAVDMFPHTPHCELVTVFERAEATPWAKGNVAKLEVPKKKKGVCFNFKHEGKCRRGDECWFSHERGPPTGNPKGPLASSLPPSKAKIAAAAAAAASAATEAPVAVATLEAALEAAPEAAPEGAALPTADGMEV